MEFLNRENELARLDSVITPNSAFVVIWGRRRVGKTRLLLEWITKHKGLYWVADESASTVQRQYLAETLEKFLPGFASVQYPDWTTFFSRLARDAEHFNWRGPLVIDEFPYLVIDSPELPSILQRFIDHEAKKAKLILVISGSSQRMMHNLVLDASEPLYGRAQEIIKLTEINPSYICQALNLENAFYGAQAYSIWGGIPRYWELAAPFGKNILEAIDSLVLDPQGPLQEEPHRLLIEEIPSALTLRPILDAIGFGVNKLSEIAGRLAQPATSLSRPMERLRDLGYVEKEIPFGSSEATSKRTLYKIKDYFLRFWFEVVASRKSIFIQIPKESRLHILQQTLPSVWSQAWEYMCRKSIPFLFAKKENLLLEPARRYWHGNHPEWDIVSLSLDKKTLVLGEVKWASTISDEIDLQRIVGAVTSKPIPLLPLAKIDIVYSVFIPIKPKGKLKLPQNVRVFDASDILDFP